MALARGGCGGSRGRQQPLRRAGTPKARTLKFPPSCLATGLESEAVSEQIERDLSEISRRAFLEGTSAALVIAATATSSAAAAEQAAVAPEAVPKTAIRLTVNGTVHTRAQITDPRTFVLRAGVSLDPVEEDRLQFEEMLVRAAKELGAGAEPSAMARRAHDVAGDPDGEHLVQEGGEVVVEENGHMITEIPDLFLPFPDRIAAKADLRPECIDCGAEMIPESLAQM